MFKHELEEEINLVVMHLLLHHVKQWGKKQVMKTCVTDGQSRNL